MIPDSAIDMFKALSDPNRLRIFDMLSRGETCSCKLLEALSISQPTLSHHMGILQKGGLVRGRRDGQWIHYSVDPDAVHELIGYLESVSSSDRADGAEGPVAN
jgi:ArsR family transcriptional regulator